MMKLIVMSTLPSKCFVSQVRKLLEDILGGIDARVTVVGPLLV